MVGLLDSPHFKNKFLTDQKHAIFGFFWVHDEEEKNADRSIMFGFPLHFSICSM